jgi:hypothetical protein
MNTITLYFDGRARARRTKSLLIGGIVAITALALADRPRIEPDEKVRIVTRTVTTTIVQIERVPASCETVGPPAPVPKPRPRVRVRRAPAVSPSHLSFLSAAWEPVAIMNPYGVPMRIRNIAIRGDGARAFEIIGTAQCIGTLRPGERCRFSVFGRPTAGSNAAIRIEIHHDADSKPLVILAATGG